MSSPEPLHLPDSGTTLPRNTTLRLSESWHGDGHLAVEIMDEYAEVYTVDLTEADALRLRDWLNGAYPPQPSQSIQDHVLGTAQRRIVIERAVEAATEFIEHEDQPEPEVDFEVGDKVYVTHSGTDEFGLAGAFWSGLATVINTFRIGPRRFVTVHTNHGHTGAFPADEIRPQDGRAS